MELPLDDTDISVKAMYRSMFQRPAARQRVLGPLSTSLQSPVAVALARRLVRPLLPGPAAASRDHRERPARHRPQLQADDSKRCPASSRPAQAARDRSSSCRPRRRLVSRRSNRRSRPASATPAGTSWSSTSVRFVFSPRLRFRCGGATKISRSAYESKHPRMGRPGRNRGSDGPAGWPSKPRWPILRPRPCESRSPASGRDTCAYIRRPRG